MSEGTVVGVQPWLPWPLHGRRWWAEPVRAERLAALRIGIAAVLLLDIFLNCLPHAADFYGANGLGATATFAAWRTFPEWNWSIILSDDPVTLQWFVVAWAVSAAGLLLGFASRLNAVV